ncbi:hypothetical protein IA539_15200 [Gordonia sp. zg691]|uniref:hypothetical protein n=1 Tax=Gordonia jinghuaiqii TaxID=2758710 RepID=UPI00166232F1|nr:hypothetical protein [Gordonia jinghuaiqii]MBD0862549.1 hypothetical protein [Gordonia jinghuaiqii]
MSPQFGWLGHPSAEPAQWLAPYPYPDGAGGWLADRYAHIVRILHPAYVDDESGRQHPVTWTQIAAATGATMSPQVDFTDVTGVVSPDPVVEGVFDDGPEMGSLPPELIESVYEHLRDARYGLFWEGWGEFLDEPIRGCARVSDGPDRGGLSYQVVQARATSEPATRMRTPNYWWPEDQSWCAATGIDEVETVVASASRVRLERLHADSRLETLLRSR